MDKTTLKQLKPGKIFRLTYACRKSENYNHKPFFKGTRTVFINFTY